MVFRNLMAMDVEEMVHAQPMDAVVLIGGCDKTLPALVMGAASADKPAIVLATGPMTTGRYRGERLGACTDCRRFWAQLSGGHSDATRSQQVEGSLRHGRNLRGHGHGEHDGILCETLGMLLPDGGDPGRACRSPARGGGDRQGRP